MDDIQAAAQPLIELAIAEDIGPGDVTSESVLADDHALQGRIIAKEAGVIAGLPIVEAVFAQVDESLCFTPRVEDGDSVEPGDVVAELTGSGKAMLAAERTALNFLQQLSGIATYTYAFVKAIRGTEATILDTRKTRPGYRVLEKYAVRMGGGQNHRHSLHDMLLIKDNHIAAAGSITAAVERARGSHPDLPIEVEVTNMTQLREALALDITRIMLDNMNLTQLREAVALTAGRTPLEASGNVDLERVAGIAATGVDYISVGALTHSAPTLDLSMDITDVDITDRILEIKSKLGDRLVILGHHYQRDDVIRFADFRGDSLKLVYDAVDCQAAKYIIFCGVHFMAEAAAIMAQPGQRVFLPDVEAGCPLADMADLPGVEQAWRQLGEVMDVEHEVMPVTYVNSSAAIKAFCGRHGGLVCTSSNAEKILSWALERRKYVFFFPDQHLGRNVGKRMGIPIEQMLLWDPKKHLGGYEAEALQDARIFLWKGWCKVHQVFNPEHVRAWRERETEVRIIVHPECKMEVVDLADEAGSTAYIIQRVEESASGAKWAIGTEFNLVNRLQQDHPDKIVASLSPKPINCRDMNKITVDKLARVLEGIAGGEFVNQITVPEDVAREARVALERMLEASR